MSLFTLTGLSLLISFLFSGYDISASLAKVNALVYATCFADISR